MGNKSRAPGERREKIGGRRRKEEEKEMRRNEGEREREREEIEDRGKSVTSRFNTWNVCDFEVDKGQPDAQARCRCFPLFFADTYRGYEISQMGY